MQTPLTITVNAQPVLTVSAPPPICRNDSATVTVSGAATYSWSPGTGLSSTTGSSVNASPAVTTTYTITGTTNGCSATKTVTVTVNPRPGDFQANSPIDYCQGAPASQLSIIPFPGNTLTWYTNPGLTGGMPTAPTPSTSVAGTTNYYVTQTNTFGCTGNAAIISVRVNPVPEAKFSMPASVCLPGGVALFNNQSTIQDNSALSFQWNFGDGTPVSANGTHVYAAAGSYPVTLTTTTAFGCSSDTMQLFNAFFTKPIIDFDVSDDTLCQGTQSMFADLSNYSNSPVRTRVWNFGDGSAPSSIPNPVKTYTRAGTFDVTLTVTNEAGCTADTTKEVIVYLQPVIDAGPSFVVALGTVVQFRATANSPRLAFSWSPANDFANPDTLRPSLRALRNQTYILTATGQANCTATDSITVKILKPVKVPNAFSPNNDGINDKWIIADLSDYPGATVEVYNRYGQVVFYSAGYGQPWDGNYKGKPLPFAVYYYVITLKNGFVPLTGSITIVK